MSIVASGEGSNDKNAFILFFRQKVVDMFHHAYDGYIKYAYPYDELRPLTCDGHDTWGRLVFIGRMVECNELTHYKTCP